MKIAIEKPGTPEEVVHFGTKGMKWGVRKSKGTREFKRKFPTSSERTAEINRARVSVLSSKVAIKTAKDKETRQQLKDLHLSNPDHATALRLTRGEKVVLGLLYSLTPTVVVPVGVAGVTAARVGKRRALEP